MENGRPAAEFIACLYLTYTRKYKRRLKVKIQIVYSMANLFVISIDMYTTT